MITFEEAIKRAEKERGKFEYSQVDSARDCEDRWFFTFAQDKDKLGAAPFFVFKSDGKCEIVFPTSENLELISRGISLSMTDRGSK